jgi:carboxymethylenebutenolidase
MANESKGSDRGLKAEDLSPEVMGFVDRYVHGFIDRREFFSGVGKLTLGGLTAAAILEAFTPNYALGQLISPDDPRIQVEYIHYLSPQGHEGMGGYLVRPANVSGPLPGVVCIHGGQGLYAHHEDIARRVALENFIAFAPDALSPLGGHPGERAAAQALMAQLDPEERVQDFIAGANFLRTHSLTTGKVGILGFCWGGGMVNTLAVRMPNLDAAVSYYGGQPDAADVGKIKTPLMLQYGGLDERLIAGWPAYEAALNAAGTNYTAHIYEGAQHAFNNDTDGPRYNKEAAELGWQRTISFFDEHLR